MLTVPFGNIERGGEEQIWRQLKEEFHLQHVGFEVSITHAQGKVRAVNVNVGIVSTEVVAIRPLE